MEKGLVSIITPMYNAEKFVSQTIETVLQANVSLLGNDYY